MATIETAIDEIKYVANAFTGISSFIYGQYAELKGQREKSYPLLLVESNPIVREFNVIRAKTTYRFTMNFFILHQRQQQAEKDDQKYEANLETLAYQYLTELRSRFYSEYGAELKLSDPINDGDYRDRAGVDMLKRLRLRVDIDVYGECGTATFNYPE